MLTAPIKDLRRLLERLRQGDISRREFLRRTALLGLTTLAALRMPGAWAADSGEPKPADEDRASANELADRRPGSEQAPPALYLTWQRDPTTTMTIQWHTLGDTGQGRVNYVQATGHMGGHGEADSKPMPFSERIVHTVELTGLEPATTYDFYIENVTPGVHSPRYRFRTMPATADEPIRLIIGGDILERREWMEETNRLAMTLDPDFIVWGGDLAYAGARRRDANRWDMFFAVMMDTLIADDGRVIPVVMAIGNHEVHDHYYFRGDRGVESYRDTDEFREEIAPYYYSLIAFPGHPGYGCLDFGDYLSLILLDSDHSGPIEGPQTRWLEETLSTRQSVTHRFPIYHVPGWPSARPVDGDFSVGRRVREHWHPLFERYGVRVAFEHHDHAYKRTTGIFNMQVDPDGIVYLGDGGWGVDLRRTHNVEMYSYLEKAQSIRHLILATVHGAHLEFDVISHQGDPIDHFIPKPHGGRLDDIRVTVRRTFRNVLRRLSIID